MVAVVLDGVIGHWDEESPSGEEVREVFLCHLTHLAHKLQRADVAAAPAFDGVVAQSLEEVGVERGVLLCEVVVEIQLPVHPQLAVDVADEERGVVGELVHHVGQRRSHGGDETVVEADVVGEEVVRGLGAAFEVDGSLVVVAALVGRAPVVHFPTDDEAVADAVHGVVAGAVGCGVGVARITRSALDGEIRVVVVGGVDILAARQVEGSSGTLAVGHLSGVAHQFLLPHGEAVEPADTPLYGFGPHGFVG